NDTATTELYTLSLHDALPIFSAAGEYDLGKDRREHPVTNRKEKTCRISPAGLRPSFFLSAARSTSPPRRSPQARLQPWPAAGDRSEEHTSELQSLTNLVCRLL